MIVGESTTLGILGKGMRTLGQGKLMTKVRILS